MTYCMIILKRFDTTSSEYKNWAKLWQGEIIECERGVHITKILGKAGEDLGKLQTQGPPAMESAFFRELNIFELARFVSRR